MDSTAPVDSVILQLLENKASGFSCADKGQGPAMSRLLFNNSHRIKSFPVSGKGYRQYYITHRGQPGAHEGVGWGTKTAVLFQPSLPHTEPARYVKEFPYFYDCTKD